MSPKNSSLAYEEQDLMYSAELEVNYLPELNLLLKVRTGFESESLDEPVQVSGYLTVSF